MYYVNIILLIIYATVLLWIQPTQGKKKVFCALAASNWILLSGLRHLDIGADTYAYYRAFHNSKFVSWHQLWENFKNTFFNWDAYFGNNAVADESGTALDILWNENTLAVKDPGYAIINKAFYSVFPDYTAFLFFIAILFMVPLAILIYKHSKEPFLSFIVYSSLFFSFFSITGHRQTIATGVALISYLLFAEKKKFIPFVLMILLVLPVHKSVVGFIPIYFLQYIKMDRIKIVAVLIAFPIVFVLRGAITNLLVSISGYSGYEELVGGGARNFLLVYIVLMFVALWKGVDTKELSAHIHGETAVQTKQENHVVVAAVCVAFILMPTTFVNTNLMRLVQYYSIFLILYVPQLIMQFRKEEYVFVYFGVTAMLLFLLFKDSPQYMFFWQ